MSVRVQTSLSRALLAVLATVLIACGGDNSPAASAPSSPAPGSAPVAVNTREQTNAVDDDDRINARLLVSPHTAEPGEELQVSVENRGRVGLTYGLPNRIQRRIHGRWRNAMKQIYGTTEPGFRRLAINVLPGETSSPRLDRIGLPRSVRPGTYRVLKRITHYDDDQLTVVARATLKARFVVR